MFKSVVTIRDNITVCLVRLVSDVINIFRYTDSHIFLNNGRRCKDQMSFHTRVEQHITLGYKYLQLLLDHSLLTVIPSLRWRVISSCSTV